MKRLLTYCFLMIIFICPGTILGGDMEAGKEKSAMCVGCHGEDGISTQPIYPNLRGQKEAYLIRQLEQFRHGMRSDPFMTALAAPLTDKDIADLAAYYASLK